MHRETAGECGAELKAAITQTGDVIWSMHKKKNSASVLAGEMILTFYKPKRVKKASPPGGNGTTSVIFFDDCASAGATAKAADAASMVRRVNFCMVSPR